MDLEVKLVADSNLASAALMSLGTKFKSDRLLLKLTLLKVKKLIIIISKLATIKILLL